MTKHFDYQDHEQLYSSAAMPFSNACNEVRFCFSFQHCKFLLCVSSLIFHSWLRQFCCLWSCSMNTCPRHLASSWLQRFLWAWQQRNMKTSALEQSAMFGVCNITMQYVFVYVVFNIYVPVAASGLGAYFLDGNSFLSKLCKCTNEEERDIKTINYDPSC